MKRGLAGYKLGRQPADLWWPQAAEHLAMLHRSLFIGQILERASSRWISFPAPNRGLTCQGAISVALHHWKNRMWLLNVVVPRWGSTVSTEPATSHMSLLECRLAPPS